MRGTRKRHAYSLHPKLGMPGDDLALDPGALVALARLTPWGDFCVRMVRTVCRPRFQRDRANRYRQHTDLGGDRLGILPNRLARDRPQPQILEAQQHREHPFELAVKMDLVPAERPQSVG